MQTSIAVTLSSFKEYLKEHSIHMLISLLNKLHITLHVDPIVGWTIKEYEQIPSQLVTSFTATDHGNKKPYLDLSVKTFLCRILLGTNDQGDEDITNMFPHMYYHAMAIGDDGGPKYIDSKYRELSEYTSYEPGIIIDTRELSLLGLKKSELVQFLTTLKSQDRIKMIRIHFKGFSDIVQFLSDRSNAVRDTLQFIFQSHIPLVCVFTPIELKHCPDEILLKLQKNFTVLANESLLTAA